MFPEHASYQEKLNFFRDRVSLYPVSCEPLANGRTDLEWLEGVLAGGAGRARAVASETLEKARQAVGLRR